MTFWQYLADILLLLAVAFAFGVGAQRLKQSPIIGYLLAGTLLGPWLFHSDALFNLAEIGVALLLFSIGLEFSFSRLRQLGKMALGGGTLQVVATMALFALAAGMFRPMKSAIAIGAMVALSSTAVVMRVLVDRAEIDSARGRNALGILLLQDIAVVPLVLLVTMLGQGGTAEAVLLQVAKTLLGAAGLVGLFYLLFYQMFPRVLMAEGMHSDRELVVLLAIVTAIGSAWMSHAVGLSPALGAFLAGMLIAESPFAVQVRSDIGSIRTLFVTLFFTAIGMLADPMWLLGHWYLVLGGLAVIVIAKTVIIHVVARIFGNIRVLALATGITLAQIGEFSFVLATTARGAGVIEPDTFSFMVSVTILSIFISPYMVSHATVLSDLLLRKLSRRYAGTDETPAGAADGGIGKRIFVIGFGPAGQQVAEGLSTLDIRPEIIELNPRSAQFARDKGLHVNIGDALSEEVILHAGMDAACLVVITIPDPRTCLRIIETIKRLAPGTTVIARCRYHIFKEEMEAAGAALVIDEENMVGKELAAAAAKCLGNPDRLFCACALAGLPSGEMREG